MRISDWSSDVCSSDLGRGGRLLALPFLARLLEVADAGQHASDQHRRQGCGEGEAGRIAADHVDDHLVGGDIAAHDAERLAQRAFDDGQAMGRSEERRLGKAWVSTCESRRWQYD